MNFDYPGADIQRSCTRKKAYSCEENATRVANRINWDNRAQGLKLIAYGCTHCGRFHIGRSPGSPYTRGSGFEDLAE